MLTSVNFARQLSWLILVRGSNDFCSCRDQARFLLQGSRAVQHTSVINFLKSTFSQDVYSLGLSNAQNLTDYVQNMLCWIQSHQSSQIIGLDKFQVDFSSGTTQSFDSFYFRHKLRRMRCLVGEYFYHLKTWTSTHTDWAFVTPEDPLSKNDALVISLPFCDTGSMHLNFDELISTCNRLGIPVLVDCCYYPISSGIYVDVNQPCIDTVAFSLSKAFPIANLRIGVRYTKPGIYDGQRLHNSINYNNSLSAWVGKQLIENFSSDYIYKAYQEKQKQVCKKLNITPSQSVLFGIGDNDWDYYSRKNLLDVYQLDFDPKSFANRISLVSIYDNWDLFELLCNETTT